MSHDDVKVTPAQGIVLDVLHDASVRLSKAFRDTMSREEAKANLEARAILFNFSNLIFKENGCPISREEVEGAAIIERSVDCA